MEIIQKIAGFFVRRLCECGERMIVKDIENGATLVCPKCGKREHFSFDVGGKIFLPAKA